MPSACEESCIRGTEAAPASHKLVQGISRVDYVDVSRGVLILLMFVVHAATPCAPSIRDPIQRLWILDIATTGFAMMAGYTIGIRYDLNGNSPQPARLLKRSAELLVVMFWSNCLLGLGKLYLTQQPDAATLASWFLGLLTFHTEYNISGVLFPIALVLPLLPFIHRSEQLIGKLGGMIWFAVILSLAMMIDRLTVEAGWLQHAKHILLEGLGGFPVLAFVAYGVLGYVNARVFQALQGMGCSFAAIVSCGIVLSSGMWGVVTSVITGEGLGRVPSEWGHTVLPFMRSEAIFLGVIALGHVLSTWCADRFVIPSLRLLGAYALCAFVFHRFVGQGLVTVLHLQGGGLGTFLFVLAVISGSTYGLLQMRQVHAGLDAGLKRLFL